MNLLEAPAGRSGANTASGALENALFIMCDQLRWDYLSCTGHPALQTPNLDRLAARGVRFDRAYVQAPVCGSSRMSYYTGRYVTSHGAIWNFVPLSLGEMTLGDFVRPHGVRCGVAGKTHVVPNREAMQRLAIDPASAQGVLTAQGGFEPVARDDGTWPGPMIPDAISPYNRFLRALGYESGNPWHDFANSAAGPDGSILSGWDMRHARKAARIRKDESETAFTTDRAIDFIREQGDAPWCLHVSFIKPHWPYVAPAPYNEMFGAEDVRAVKQSARERENAHPVVAHYRNWEPCVNESRAEVRETIIPTYMGLIREVDDQLGRLFAALDEAGRTGDTLIVFCSDHGDYLGDHFLAEKDLFHDTVARIPFIVADPRPSANATRGTVSNRLVEAIDVIPTILDALGLPIPEHILEGRSVLPLLSGQPVPWREAAFSEATYAFRDIVRLPLGKSVDECSLYMVRTDRWKYNFYDGLPCELFELDADPDEFHDLGRDPAYSGVREEMQALLFDWMRHRAVHPTIAREVIAQSNAIETKVGVKIGVW